MAFLVPDWTRRSIMAQDSEKEIVACCNIICALTRLLRPDKTVIKKPIKRNKTAGFACLSGLCRKRVRHVDRIEHHRQNQPQKTARASTGRFCSLSYRFVQRRTSPRRLPMVKSSVKNKELKTLSKNRMRMNRMKWKRSCEAPDDSSFCFTAPLRVSRFCQLITSSSRTGRRSSPER